MSKIKRCSSSSSDSEEDLKFKECVASFEAEKKVSVTTTSTLKSKRFVKEADPEDENIVSAEFQAFVAKKLSAKLDE